MKLSDRGLIRRWNLWKTGLEEQEIYFSLHRDMTTGAFALVLSRLPRFSTLVSMLPSETFRDKFLLVYLGPHCSVSLDTLAHAGLPFQTIPCGTQTLCSLRLSDTQWPTFVALMEKTQDWWLLTKTEAPSAESVRHEGIMANAAAFHDRTPDLKGEVLLNYFMDPSFHGSHLPNVRLLLLALFRSALRRVFGDVSKISSSLAAPEPILERFGLQEIPTNVTLWMRSYRLFGGTQPRCVQSDWMSGEKARIVWNAGAWGQPVVLARSARQHWFHTIRQYLAPLSLIPVALVVIPITVIMWPFVAVVRRVLAEWEKDWKP